VSCCLHLLFLVFLFCLQLLDFVAIEWQQEPKGNQDKEREKPTSTKNLQDTSQLTRGHSRIRHSKGSNYIEFRRKERLLRPFERPRFPLLDLPPVARIRLFPAEPIGSRVMSSMCWGNKIAWLFQPIQDCALNLHPHLHQKTCAKKIYQEVYPLMPHIISAEALLTLLTRTTLPFARTLKKY